MERMITPLKYMRQQADIEKTIEILKRNMGE